MIALSKFDKTILLSLLVASVSMFGCQTQSISHSDSIGEWSNYGKDPGGTRFSPLEQINRDNVGELALAWSYQTGELDTYGGTDVASKAAFEATPLMINDVLYFSTPTNRVFAISADSGQHIWTYDPKVNLQKGYSEITSRGVSVWVDSNAPGEEFGSIRIISATIDGRLIALDGATGAPVSSFGKDGIIDLTEGIGQIQVTSPPAIINDLIITGSTMGDNHRIDYPAGVVRAYHGKTGKLVWSWDPIPRNPEDPAYETWNGPSVQQTGAANAWAPLSVDIERDLVFIPTSSPSPDYYGGERVGDNKYANSLVALKASTGQVVWHFQTVHHDIWDYDVPAQPVLFDLEREGDTLPVVLIVTKMGHIFVFNRETGDPIFGIEERSVPQSDIPGEITSATQPFPTELPILGLQQFGLEDAWGPTPELQEKAQQRVAGLVNKGIFTPPSLEGTIVTPSNVGGMNWSGATVDTKRQIMITNTNRLAALITLYNRDEKSPQSINEKLPRAEIGMQLGTPYLMTRDYLFSLDPDNGFIMQTNPPFGTLAAVDLKSGALKWEVPLGIMMNPDKFPGAENWGSINIGGATTTNGGLTFIAASADGILRAFDTETGALLWQYTLPAGGQATPMTYQSGEKQYVVIAAGGHGKFGTELGDYILAFALTD